MKRAYHRTNIEKVAEGKFQRFCFLNYESRVGDQNPYKGCWEITQRTTRETPFDAFKQSPCPIPVDAVEMTAIVSKGGSKFLVLVGQYRPPLDAVALEFPAGLIDKGESVTTAALRELKEETGYTAFEEDVVSTSKPMCYEPGMTDSCGSMVHINVDGDREDNISPKQTLDDCEDIEIILLPFDNKKEALKNALGYVTQKEQDGHRVVIDAKLYTFLSAFSLY
ncbi:ADP-ribose pyrophosphatase [Strigomonas culicis]|uniref:ADP-ribose pyrophosphatase n=1 Tax=Strigomonas culicis TaxID=28005 RepID=S9VIP2_9TRYP|nr:ADP-ribose pyrophosphatase [Strigomonas culicis]EPY29505.1 ADP-ribose pyrophosphatase [Strigomonas culicis]|eukprot:EPY26986.1 ADP-ribose pyrophosphatase [Strigomonas culicis]